MNCRDFSATLRAFADVLNIAGAPVARDHIMVFAAAFDAHATCEISDLVKNLAALPRTASTGNPRLGEVSLAFSQRSTASSTKQPKAPC